MTTKIEWTDETWNPVTGCSKVSQGCKNCYAERLWPKVAGAEAARLDRDPRAFTDIGLHYGRLDQPLRWRTRKRIFVNSMSDLFHEEVPDDFILRVFDVMRKCCNGYARELDRLVPSHQFQILTKRPGRMLDFCTRLRFAQNDDRGLYLAKELPHNGFNPMRSLTNVWLGVSVEDQETANERIPLLLQTPAAVRFLSCEPLLGPIVFLPPWVAGYDFAGGYKVTAHRLDWVIAGGESGPKARPTHPDWIRSLRDQCTGAGVAFFFKQWGEWAPCDTDVDAGDYGRTLHPNEETVTEAMAFIERGFTVSEAHGCEFFRAGKKLAGRHLDGRTHDEYPA